MSLFSIRHQIHFRYCFKSFFCKSLDSIKRIHNYWYCIQILFMKIYSYVFVCDSLLLSIISTSQVITILLQVTDLLVKCIQYHTLCSYVLRSHLQKFWRHLNVQILFQYSPIICCCMIHLWWKSIEDLYT